jgi:radical SAM superfamily enzyme YgiQ (UPF0313 family)
MKVTLIKASADSGFKDYKQQLGSPPQNVWSVAAIMPDHIDYNVFDETANAKAPAQCDADLVAIFMSTPDAVRGYQLADGYRSQGITVVIGGLHASALPNEAALHADSVLIGEAEGVWEQLLEDFSSDSLKARYENIEPVDMADLKPFPHHRIDLTAYGGIGTVMVGRGCKFRCTYCTIPGFFKGNRYRPVGHIIDEIKASGLQNIELHCDNLFANPDYALELFTALKPLNIYWSGEATINMAQNEEVLKAAAESGLWYLLAGVETSSQAALKKAGKGFVRIDRVKENIERLHDYDIAVDSAMLFGFDEHDQSIFEETLDFVEDVKLDVAHSVLVTPFPGTAMFEQMEQQGRILTRDWSQYDCEHVVFQPKQMTPQELIAGRDWFYYKHNSLTRRFKRRMHMPNGLKYASGAWF